jgi:RHS repeat-associated protein
MYNSIDINKKSGDLQPLQNMPFGEQFVDQRNSSWTAPYRFTGKERDSETGFDYFGARYYDSDLSVWLSVDPLSDKYPSMSAYMYCAGNPVMLIDPNGMFATIPPFTIDLMQWYIQMSMSASSTAAAAVRLSTNTSGNIPNEAPVPESVRKQVNTNATWADVNTVAEGVNNVGMAAVTVASFIPGAETIVDAVGLLYSVSTGDETGTILYAAGLLIPGMSGGALNTVRSVVKNNKTILKLAKETFKGNLKLRQEANNLIKQLHLGNMNPGKGSRYVEGLKGVYEARGNTEGARVYFRNTSDGVEIVGYSNKGNQTQVINELKKIYGN